MGLSLNEHIFPLNYFYDSENLPYLCTQKGFHSSFNY